jgi:hypothetical protein
MTVDTSRECGTIDARSRALLVFVAKHMITKRFDFFLVFSRQLSHPFLQEAELSALSSQLSALSSQPMSLVGLFLENACDGADG